MLWSSYFMIALRASSHNVVEVSFLTSVVIRKRTFIIISSVLFFEGRREASEEGWLGHYIFTFTNNGCTCFIVKDAVLWQFTQVLFVQCSVSFSGCQMTKVCLAYLLCWPSTYISKHWGVFRFERQTVLLPYTWMIKGSFPMLWSSYFMVALRASSQNVVEVSFLQSEENLHHLSSVLFFEGREETSAQG